VDAARRPNLFLRLSASFLIAVGTLFALIFLMAVPRHFQDIAIGFGLVVTGLLFLLCTRLRASTWILSLLLLGSVIVNLCLALRLGQTGSFGDR
jgi:hypothetical protein